MKNVHWPGRLQLIEKPDGQKILLDGAHNVAGAKVLREAIENNFSPETNVSLILGILQDKDRRHICEILAPLAKEILAVRVSSERTANPTELEEICRKINPSARVSTCASLSEALQKVSRENFAVVTGSLYLVGEALELLGLSPVSMNERALNEWSLPFAPK